MTNKEILQFEIQYDQQKMFLEDSFVVQRHNGIEYRLINERVVMMAMSSAADAAREDEAGKLFTEDEVCMIYDFFVITKRQSFRSALQEYKNEKK